MDTLKNELDAQYPSLSIQILGVNEFGQAQGNSLAVVGRDIPLLQDEDANHDGDSDAWASWDVEWRDVVILNTQMEEVGVFNLTTYDLGASENYSAAKEILVGVAQGKKFWQNPSNRLDVSGDGQMTPIDDVLRLINEINFSQVIGADGRLPLPMPPQQPAPYFDVNGDGFLTAVADILPVINFFNAGAGEGEGESSQQLDVSPTDVNQAAPVLPLWVPHRQPDNALKVSSNGQLTTVPPSADVEVSNSLSLAHTGAADTEICQTDFSRAWKEHPAELLGLLEDSSITTVECLLWPS